MTTALHLGVVILCALVALSILHGTLRAGISPMPSSAQARAAALRFLPARVDTVLELGSGTGGLALALARSRPASQVIGFELSPLPWLVSWLRARRAGLGNLSLRRGDFWRDAPLETADVVVCYLYPGGMTRLSPVLRARLHPGAVVISLTFRLPGWTPDAETVLRDAWRTRVYRYVVSERRTSS